MPASAATKLVPNVVSGNAVRVALVSLAISFLCASLTTLPAAAAGTASNLAVSTQPSTTATSGQPLTTQPVISVEDSSGNVVTTATGTITASIASGSGAISAGATAAISNGVATFSGLTITGATGNDTLAFVDGTLATAVTWTGTSMSTSDNWYSVTYGNGIFVAVAFGSGVAYSTDGSTWTSATMPFSATWSSITYGNGVFVAVARNSADVAYSSDGSTWSSATIPGGVASWYSVTYGNGEFVAVANNSADAAYSVDGSAWTLATLPSSSNWQSVAYGNGRFVALATGTSSAAYSSDGSTWSTETMPVSANWYSIAYGNGEFVAVALGSDNAAYSSDGLTWSGATMPSSTNWYSITYGDGVFVAISDNSSVATSTNGSDWSGASLPSFADWSSVVFGNGVFVAVSYNNTIGAVATSLTAAPSSPINLTAPSGGGSGGGSSPSAAQLRITASNLIEPYGASWSASADVSGVQPGDTAAVSGTVFTFAGTASTNYAASTVEPTNPGTYSITPSRSTVTITPNGDAANYGATIEYVPGTLVISAATLVTPTMTGISVPAHSVVFNAVLHGEMLQGTDSVSISGATTHILSRSPLRVVVRVALTRPARIGEYVAVVRFVRGRAARFYLSVMRHGNALEVRASLRP